MAHANGKLIVEVESTSGSDSVQFINSLSDQVDFISTEDYPDDPHDDLLFEGLPVEINGNTYNWSYGGGGEYEGNYETLGFYIGFTPKKYGGRTDLSTVQERASDLVDFAEAAQEHTDREVEDYITVITV